MKLTEIASDKTRIFNGVTPDGHALTFVGKHVHTTEIGGEIWLGKVKIGDGAATDAALCVGSDGVIIAINFAAPKAAVEEVIRIRQRSFGPSLRPDRNWRIKGYNGTKLENYS